MRIAHTGDLHLTNRGTIAGRYVLRDGVNLCLWDKIQALRVICDYVETEDIDLTVVAGDVFDNPNPENVAIKVAVGTIERPSEYAPVVIIKGNHDGGKGGEFATALAPFGKRSERFGVYVTERHQIFTLLT
ncbi:MAG: hypothetical protein EHM36_05310, partial [Deltaproteobacteria bacterium]